MDMFPWKSEYSVNIPEIDRQHQKLLSLVNDLDRGVKSGQSRLELQRIFAGLLEYALFHFQAEEELMSNHLFPGLDEHKKEHEEFRKKIVEFLDAFLDTDARVQPDMMAYLEGWLQSHVFVTDKKYAAFLNERGVF